MMQRNIEADARPPISVALLTRGMRASLAEAVQSVYSQDYRPVRLIVFVDGSANVDIPLAPPGWQVNVVHIERCVAVEGRVQTLQHVGRLRNIAWDLVQTELIAFLDDDNTWAPNHLSTLFDTLSQSGATAAHSWRMIMSADGYPTPVNVFPWLPSGTPVERRAFRACCETGVLREGDSTMRDSMSSDLGVQNGIVDMGAWLIAKSALSDFHFPETFTDREIAEGAGEDDALIEYLRKHCFKVACSERATLNYRLGGFSNFTDAAERRVRNTALSQLDIVERRTMVRGMPRFVLVELTRFCNLTCGMCRDVAVSRKERMSSAMFDRLEAEILPFADIVDLRGWGESLLLPEFPDRLERTAKQGARVRVVTNLSFRRDSVLHALAEVGAYVGTSIDAGEPTILASLRKGVRPDLLHRNLAMLGELYASRGQTERLCLYVTVQKPALSDLANLVELAASTSVKDVRLAPVSGVDGSPLSIDGCEGLLESSLGRVRERADALGVRVSATARLPGDDHVAGMPSPCLHPWTHCYVAWDGRIGFCDHLIGPAGQAFILGSLADAPFETIWNGADWVALREEHLGARRADAPRFRECAWCYANRHLDSEDLLYPELEACRTIVARGGWP